MRSGKRFEESLFCVFAYNFMYKIMYIFWSNMYNLVYILGNLVYNIMYNLFCVPVCTFSPSSHVWFLYMHIFGGTVLYMYKIWCTKNTDKCTKSCTKLCAPTYIFSWDMYKLSNHNRVPLIGPRDAYTRQKTFIIPPNCWKINNSVLTGSHWLRTNPPLFSGIWRSKDPLCGKT